MCGVLACEPTSAAARSTISGRLGNEQWPWDVPTVDASSTVTTSEQPSAARVRGIFPMAGTRVNTVRPAVRWETAAGVRGAVRVEWCRDARCVTVGAAVEVAEGAQSAAASADLAHGVWFWRVTVGGVASTPIEFVVPRTGASAGNGKSAVPYLVDFDRDRLGDGYNAAEVHLRSANGALRQTVALSRLPRPTRVEGADGGAIVDAATAPTAGLPSEAFNALTGAAPSEPPSAAYDVDGDGMLDVVAIADGALWVWYGTGDGGFSAPVRRALVIEPGSAPCELRFVGDVDGDGRGELLRSCLAQTRTAAVLFGADRSAGELRSIVLASPANAPAFTMIGSAHDVNGDGLVDLVGASSQSAGELRVTLFLGAPSGLAARDVSVPPPRRMAIGRSIVAGGDANGDGRSDLLVASHGGVAETRNAPPRTDWFELALWPGADSGLGAALQATPARRSGRSIDTSAEYIGDVNGDGATDVVLSEGPPESWTVYFLGGSRGLQVGRPLRVSQQGYLGASPRAAGDQDHDGYDDVSVRMHAPIDGSFVSLLCRGSAQGLIVPADPPDSRSGQTSP